MLASDNGGQQSLVSQDKVIIEWNSAKALDRDYCSENEYDLGIID